MTSPSETRPGLIVPPAGGGGCLEQDRSQSSSRVTVLDISRGVQTELVPMEAEMTWRDFDGDVYELPCGKPHVTRQHELAACAAHSSS
jgi:hypothetical protein